MSLVVIIMIVFGIFCLIGFLASPVIFLLVLGLVTMSPTILLVALILAVLGSR